MINLKETATEYLLYIPASQKERAKKIQGRQWDTERVCWVYPKSKRVFDELIAEFGDDIQKFSINPPLGNSETFPSSSLQKENLLLRDELEEIKKSIKEVSASTNNSTNSQILVANQRILSLTTEIAKTKAELENREKELAETKSYLQASQIQATRLRKSLEEKDSLKSNPDDLMKERAKEATSNDPKFCALMDKTPLDKTFLNELTNKMAYEFKKLSNNYDHEISLYDLIIQASDADILPPEAIDLAHLIRKERNKVIHGQAYEKTHGARILLSLYAAALLWPYFPE